METTEQATLTQPLMTRNDQVIDAIQTAMHAKFSAADAEMLAEIAESRALIQSEQSSDAKRRAEATAVAAPLWCEAKKAQSRAYAATAVVDLLLGGRSRG